MKKEVVDAITVKMLVSKDQNTNLVEYLDKHFKDVTERKMVIEADKGAAIRAVELLFKDEGLNLMLSINTLMGPSSIEGNIMHTYINEIEPILSYLCDYHSTEYLLLSGPRKLILASTYEALIKTLFGEYESIKLTNAEIQQYLVDVPEKDNVQCFTDLTHRKALNAFLTSDETEAQICCATTNAVFKVNTVNDVLVFERISTSDTDRLLEATCTAYKALDMIHHKLESMRLSNADTKAIVDSAYQSIKTLI